LLGAEDSLDALMGELDVQDDDEDTAEGYYEDAEMQEDADGYGYGGEDYGDVEAMDENEN